MIMIINMIIIFIILIMIMIMIFSVVWRLYNVPRSPVTIGKRDQAALSGKSTQGGE